MKTAILLIFCLTAVLTASEIEPGPESGGLRMKLIVSPVKSGLEVRVEIENVSDRPITMKGSWWHDSSDGDFADYIAAALSIETWPAITPWMGQTMAGDRTKPQPEQSLDSGKTWSTTWKTDGKRLKSHVTDPLSVHNPKFPFPGLYSVHGSLRITTTDDINGEQKLMLRSNEQLVSVGDSKAAPKHTYGHLWGANEEDKTASLSLGQLQQIKVGDEFEIVTGMGESWKLTITKVYPDGSSGKLDPLRKRAQDRRPPFPKRGDEATLILKKS